MKRVCVIGLLAAFALSVNGQQPATKVAIVSLQGAIAGTKDGQKAAQELDKKVAPKQKEFATRQAEISQLQEQYSKGGAVMAEDRRNQAAREIEEKKKRLERDVQDAEEEVRNEQEKIVQSLGQRMTAMIEKYAKDNGYTLVVDVSNPNTDVLYAAQSFDITQSVITLYDETAAKGSSTTPRPN
jgi:outer membrane protein